MSKSATMPYFITTDLSLFVSTVNKIKLILLAPVDEALSLAVPNILTPTNVNI